MWVHYKAIDDGYRSINMMLIHESHVLELLVDTKYELCDPHSLLMPFME